MNTKETLNKIRVALGMDEKVEKPETSLATAKLKNGAELEAEAFEVGADVFVVVDEQKEKLPDGDYELEDGTQFVIKEGKISEMGAKKEEEVPVEAEKKQEEELSIEETAPKKVVETKEVHFSNEQKNIIKEMFAEFYSELKSKEAELSSDKIDEQLKEAASEGIKHSPEAKTEKKLNLYSTKRESTILDRIYQRQFNRK